METKIGVNGNDGRQFAATEMEGDGRLMLATEDEIMDVESLLIDNESEMHIVSDDGQPAGYFSNEGCSTGIFPLESSEGLLQSENIEVDPDALNTRIEYFEEMLQQVKEEETHCLPCGSPDYSSAYVNVDSHSSDWQEIFPGIDEKLQSQLPLQETLCSLASTLGESHMYQSGSSDDCLNLADKMTEVGSLTSITVTSEPEFFKSKEEIHLDNLTIKELHETFRTTFGRETTVKDKSWLKRRIAMGLNKSCDTSVSQFIIKDDKLVKRMLEGTGRYSNVGAAFSEDQRIGVHTGNENDAPSTQNGQLDNDHVISENRLRNQGRDNCCNTEGNSIEERSAKRVRRPTKRYIEELSQVEFKESNRSLINTVKSSTLGQMSPKSHFSPCRNVPSNGRTFVMRLDSLGGSGILVPCASCVRRTRPRKNFMALLKFNPCDKGMASTLVKKALVACSFHNESGNKVITRRSFPRKITDVWEKETQISAISPHGLRHHMRIKNVVSSGNFDDDVVAVSTPKGGIRRKHHRAWTLSEVIKLVDGVSKFGAGRWSEIKRRVFASYSYRTAVDLKDKWRNLLKASVIQSSDKQIHQRKPASSMSIPASILLRVRDLSSMQQQLKPNRYSSKACANIPKRV